MNIIWSARRAYLAGDFEKTLETLGVALHYVQDNCVIGAGERFRRIHDRVKREIASLKVPVDAIREGFKKAECSPLFIRAVLYNIKLSTDPVEALRNSCLYSAMIAGAVYNPSQPPREVLEILVKVKMEEAKNARKAKRIARISIALLAIGLALTPIQPLISAIPLALSLTLLLAALIRRVDPQFEQLAWYGLV